MTKKKNFISRLFFGVVALTLVSFCFLGSTFARYTSSKPGSATVQVAKWDVKFDNDGGSTDVSFSKLSPSIDAWASGTTRKHTTASTQLLVITNNSEVSAKITIKVDGFTINNGAPLTYEDGSTADKQATETNVKSLFSIALTGSAAWETESAWKPESDGSYTITLAPGASVTVSGVVTWTSKDNIDGDDGTKADQIDTWVGKNVTEVSWRLTYTAVQASELP